MYMPEPITNFTPASGGVVGTDELLDNGTEDTKRCVDFAEKLRQQHNYEFGIKPSCKWSQ